MAATSDGEGDGVGAEVWPRPHVGAAARERGEEEREWGTRVRPGAMGAAYRQGSRAMAATAPLTAADGCHAPMNRRTGAHVGYPVAAGPLGPGEWGGAFCFSLLLFY